MAISISIEAEKFLFLVKKRSNSKLEKDVEGTKLIMC